MIRAIIFDFDGVVVNSEPVHLAAFRQVAEEEGMTLTDEEYTERYLALDDRGCFEQLLRSYGRPVEVIAVEALARRKAEYFQRFATLPEVPGTRDFILRVKDRFILAIASGALRTEIEKPLRQMKLRPYFSVIVSAEDCQNCKPHPEPYLKALERLNEVVVPPLKPKECLVIEDAVYGIKAAKSAGMRCIALTTSYPADRLIQADRVVKSLGEVTLEDIAQMGKE